MNVSLKLNKVTLYFYAASYSLRPPLGIALFVCALAMGSIVAAKSYLFRQSAVKALFQGEGFSYLASSPNVLKLFLCSYISFG